MNLRLIAGLLVVAVLAWGSVIAWVISALDGASLRTIARVAAGAGAAVAALFAVKDQWLELAAAARARRHMSPEWLAYMRGDRSPGSAK